MKGFSRVVVIGYGVVTGKVLSCVWDHVKEYRYEAEYIEHEIHPFNTAKRYATCNQLPFRVIEDKTELSTYLMNMNEKTLVISASNNFLFSGKLIDKENITIINFHNALLPAYPGRNAPSWVIYEGQKVTGITWHYVTEGIDTGDIIIQRQQKIPEDIKAYELASALMYMAAEAFQDCFEEVLLERVIPTRQLFLSGRKIYGSKEIPGNGSFKLTDDPEKIYRLLRALDYGKNDIFPLAKTEFQGREVRIQRYKLIPKEKWKEEEKFINIPYDNKNILQLKYRE